MPYHYLNDYFLKVEPDYFHPIQNSVGLFSIRRYRDSLADPHSPTQNLQNVDIYRYDKKWELDATEALTRLYGIVEVNKDDNVSMPLTPSLRKDVILLDLRAKSDYSSERLPGAINLPLRTLTESTAGASDNSRVLEAQWLELEERFSATPIAPLMKHPVTLVCYDGDTSRIATSVLRNKGVDAFSVRNGFQGLWARAERSWATSIAGTDA